MVLLWGLGDTDQFVMKINGYTIKISCYDEVSMLSALGANGNIMVLISVMTMQPAYKYILMEFQIHQKLSLL